MTCNVLMGTLNPTHSLTHSLIALPHTLAGGEEVAAPPKNPTPTLGLRPFGLGTQ